MISQFMDYLQFPPQNPIWSVAVGVIESFIAMYNISEKKYIFSCIFAFQPHERSMSGGFGKLFSRLCVYKVKQLNGP